jgi:hypothetical protein
MRQAAANAPLFIEAFYEGCESLRSDVAIALPTVQQINRIPARYEVMWEIRPPDLVKLGVLRVEGIAVPERAPSLNEQAQELIQRSLSQSQQLPPGGLESDRGVAAACQARVSGVRKTRSVAPRAPEKRMFKRTRPVPADAPLRPSATWVIASVAKAAEDD